MKKSQVVKKASNSSFQHGNSKCHILKKCYGSEKLSHDAFRDRLIKFLTGEALKSYNIPLPPAEKLVNIMK